MIQCYSIDLDDGGWMSAYIKNVYIEGIEGIFMWADMDCGLRE